MLNEEKIRWMTRASIYEKRQGHTDLERNEYFLGDYVRLHLMKNMIGVTVAYILMVGLYAVCKIEDIFALAANMQLMVFLKEVLLVYLILALIYTGIGIIYYAWQYQSSHKQLKKYYRILRHIDQCGEKNSKQNGQLHHMCCNNCCHDKYRKTARNNRADQCQQYIDHRIVQNFKISKL